jgi:AbrB family looped-hinge helix DNA binding protein
MERVRVAKNGRLVIPAVFRRALGLTEGGEVLVRLREGCLELEVPGTTVQRACAAVRRYSGERDLAGELLRERREEASDDG